jgi:hypothetical protein
MASHQRNILLYLQRKKDAAKLEYELKKMLKLMGDRLGKIQLPDEAPEQVKEASGATMVNPEEQTGQQSKETGKAEQTEVSDEQHKILQNKRVNPEDLPEELQQVYNEVAQAHKEMRSVHEKMKLAGSDEQRAAFRQQLIALDEVVTEGWKAIDEYMLIKHQPETTKPQTTVKEPEVSDLTKSIGAARTYISRNLSGYEKADEKKKLELQKKINERVTLLIENKASVSVKTKNALIELPKTAIQTK